MAASFEQINIFAFLIAVIFGFRKFFTREMAGLVVICTLLLKKGR
jgi:hypothetical protein